MVLSQEQLDSFIRSHLSYQELAKDAEVQYLPNEIDQLIEQSREIFKNEPTLVTLNPPCIIVGDIHGQYFDLIRMFSLVRKGKKPGKGSMHGAREFRFMFLGDYVDRGRNSIECICLVLALKCRYPNQV